MGRFVEHGGCRLAFEVRGAGPPVLFIQGVGVPGGGWRPQTDALAGGYSCLTFDNRGLGGSVPAGGPITADGMADDARAVLDAAVWESAHVVGHSLGGLVAVLLALAAPRRVRSLALLCTFPGGRAAAPPSFRMVWLGMRTSLGTRRMRRRAFARLVSSPGLADPDAAADRLSAAFGRDVADQPRIVGEQLRALRRADATARLGKLVGVPALVVSAAHDPIAPPRAGRSLADGIPGARYVEAAEASHALPITHADWVNALLADHLAAAEAAWAGRS